MPPDAEHPFAPFVRTLGRGPGRSRSLTREEARGALEMVLRGEVEPIQAGAFLMLLRYRGEDPAEIAGLVEAARKAMQAGPHLERPAVMLDWPSYDAAVAFALLTLGRADDAQTADDAAATIWRARHRPEPRETFAA